MSSILDERARKVRKSKTNLRCGLHYQLKTCYENLNLILSCFKERKNRIFDNMSAFSCDKTTNGRNRILYEFQQKNSNILPKKGEVSLKVPQ